MWTHTPRSINASPDPNRRSGADAVRLGNARVTHPADAPQPGDRFLGPSGRIWTVQTITTRGNRIVLTTPTPDGDSAAIVDHLAVARMIPLPIATSSPDDTPATAGVKPMRWWHRDARGRRRTTPGHPPYAAAIAHDDDDRLPGSRPVSHERRTRSGGLLAPASTPRPRRASTSPRRSRRPSRRTPTRRAARAARRRAPNDAISPAWANEAAHAGRRRIDGAPPVGCTRRRVRREQRGPDRVRERPPWASRHLDHGCRRVSPGGADR